MNEPPILPVDPVFRSELPRHLRRSGPQPYNRDCPATFEDFERIMRTPRRKPRKFRRRDVIRMLRRRNAQLREALTVIYRRLDHLERTAEADAKLLARIDRLEFEMQQRERSR